MSAYFRGAVEGIVDEAVLERLLRLVGATVGPIHRNEGKPRLLDRLQGFNEAARHAPWFVLVDLDTDDDCAPTFARRHLPRPSSQMVFRVAVREVEAWLMADRERFASWFQVPERAIPTNPDLDRDPKSTIIRLAGRSRSRSVRADLVPREGSGRAVGPLYPSRMIEYIRDEKKGWRPRSGAKSSDSLDRCIRRLAETIRPRRRS